MTPFNRPITQHRRVTFRSLSLDSVKAIKSAFGFSINDVVLALRADALRRWLADHHALPEAPLITMIPMSIATQLAGERWATRSRRCWPCCPRTSPIRPNT